MIRSGPVQVRKVETPDVMRAIKVLRHRVFVEEQGVPEEEEYDAYDDLAVHAVAWNLGVVVGTGRVFQDASGMTFIGRMAVDAAWRRRGIGGQVLHFLEEVARQQGRQRVSLHAQTYVKTFYASHGYREEGDVFLEAGIQHVMMSKDLG